MEAAALGRAPRRGLAAAGQARLLRLAGDARLAKAVGAGSDAAFEVLYERHHRPLLAFCRHMLGNREEAEDALQSTFMAAYRELRSGPGHPVELRPWLYTIARHRCQRTLRARTPRDLDEARSAVTEGLGDQVQRRAELRAILADLVELPEEQRAALLLAQLHGMTHAEIGAVLEVPTKKVKALVFQARASLVASREARAIPCAEIRAQLAELSGGALRRRPLQRHLRTCEGCREFRVQVRRQRRLLAAALPVVPSAGLREAVLGATTGGVASAGGAGGLLTGAGALKGVAVKLGVGAGATAALAGGMAAGGSLLHPHRHAVPPPPAAARAQDPDRSAALPLRAAAVSVVPIDAARVHLATTATATRHGRRHHRGRTEAPPARRHKWPGANGRTGTSSEASATAPASTPRVTRGQGGGRAKGNDGGNAGRSTAQRGNGTGSAKSSGGEAPRGLASNPGTPAAGQRTPASGLGGGSKGRGAAGPVADTPSAAVSRDPATPGGTATPPGQAKK